MAFQIGKIYLIEVSDNFFSSKTVSYEKRLISKLTVQVDSIINTTPPKEDGPLAMEAN